MLSSFTSARLDRSLSSVSWRVSAGRPGGEAKDASLDLRKPDTDPSEEWSSRGRCPCSRLAEFRADWMAGLLASCPRMWLIWLVALEAKWESVVLVAGARV